MLTHKLMVLAACLMVPAFSSPIQWTLASGGNGHWYDLTTTPSTWTASNTQAINAGGYLATITSGAEDTFLIDNFSTLKQHLWIGLTDAAIEGTFVWVTGEPLTYTNWLPGEPNNGFPCCAPDEDYGELVVVPIPEWVVPGWNDLPNAGPDFQPILGIVEFNTNPIPEPTTVSISAAGLLALFVLRSRRVLASRRHRPNS
jgi:hypothetical protein